MRTQPYREGDRAQVLYNDRSHGTSLATVTIDRITALPENGRWLITYVLPDHQTNTANVNMHGSDRHGYVQKV
jgi:hypothetical protein